MSSKDPRYIALVNCTKWRKLRAWQLSQHPLCERCKINGRSELATCVHHIDPVEDCHTLTEMQRRCYNPLNLMSLCHQCHAEIHAGYHTSTAVAQRNTQRAARSITHLQGYDDSDYQLTQPTKQNNLPQWQPTTKPSTKKR